MWGWFRGAAAAVDGGRASARIDRRVGGGWWPRARSWLGLGKGGVRAAGWSGRRRQPGGRALSTRSSWCGITPQNDERVASALGSSGY
jgi:hypothetical protein